MFWISNVYSDYSEEDFVIYLNVAKKVDLQCFFLSKMVIMYGDEL